MLSDKEVTLLPPMLLGGRTRQGNQKKKVSHEEHLVSSSLVSSHLVSSHTPVNSKVGQGDRKASTRLITHKEHLTKRRYAQVRLSSGTHNASLIITCSMCCRRQWWWSII